MKKSFAYSVIAFIIVFSIGIALVYFIEQRNIYKLRKAVTEVAVTQAHSISRQLDRSLSSTYALASLLKRYGEINNFDSLAEDMIKRYGGISSLQLAPDGVVRRIFPLQGNEAAIGHDLLNDPDRRANALETIRSGKLTVAGPLKLIQGGVAVIGRYPVFLPDKNSGGESFWGFTIALIRLTELLKASNIHQLISHGYDYEISRTSPDNSAPFVFAQSHHRILQDPVTITIEVPNGQWSVSIAPKNGWIARLHILHEILITLLVSIIISSLLYQRFKNVSDLSKSHRILKNEILERKRLEKELKVLSITDDLTGLYNRRGFFTMAEHYIKIAQREKNWLLLLFADLDNLKAVNDSSGHQAGDVILAETAKILKSTYRETDIIARIGGDEFSVISLETSENNKGLMIERFQKNIEAYNMNKDSINRLSVSIGVAEYDPSSMQTLNELLSRADKLMYEQKLLKKQY